MIFTLVIAYLQDLLTARPGAGGSLLALQKVSADGLTTGAYAVGAWAQGYATVAVLGAAISLAAMATLLRLHRECAPGPS